MKKLGGVLILLCALFSVPSSADVIRTGIGIQLSEYPELEAVPGYPVYYAPQLQMNYFFYEGKYWVYQDDNWYESSWYDGPWWQVDPEDVPDFILRVPLQYYLEPPTFFFGWIAEEPPHWGERWGDEWVRHRHGWDKWDHRIHHKAAPLPLYQKDYSGDRYPRQPERQHELHQKNYHYEPHDPFVQQRRHERTVQGAPVRQETRRSTVPQQGNPAATAVITPQKEAVKQQREVRHEQRVQESQGREERQQGQGSTREQRRGQDQDRGKER